MRVTERTKPLITTERFACHLHIYKTEHARRKVAREETHASELDLVLNDGQPSSPGFIPEQVELVRVPALRVGDDHNWVGLTCEKRKQ